MSNVPSFFYPNAKKKTTKVKRKRETTPFSSQQTQALEHVNLNNVSENAYTRIRKSQLKNSKTKNTALFQKRHTVAVSEKIPERRMKVAKSMTHILDFGKNSKSINLSRILSVSQSYSFSHKKHQNGLNWEEDQIEFLLTEKNVEIASLRQQLEKLQKKPTIEVSVQEQDIMTSVESYVNPERSINEKQTVSVLCTCSKDKIDKLKEELIEIQNDNNQLMDKLASLQHSKKRTESIAVCLYEAVNQFLASFGLQRLKNHFFDDYADKLDYLANQLLEKRDFVNESNMSMINLNDITDIQINKEPCRCSDIRKNFLSKDDQVLESKELQRLRKEIKNLKQDLFAVQGLLVNKLGYKLPKSNIIRGKGDTITKAITR